MMHWQGIVASTCLLFCTAVCSASLRHRSEGAPVVENQYFVLLKTHRPSRSLQDLLHRRRLAASDDDTETTMVGLLRTVQNLQQDDLDSLMNNDEVAFVEPVRTRNIIGYSL